MRRFCSLIALVATIVGTSANAQTPGDAVTFELRPGWRDGETHVAGLRVVLAPGWKTYWRSPGAGGIPPRISVDGKPVRIHWPVPQVFDDNGLQSVGYTGEVTFPLHISTPQAGARNVTVNATIGVCKDICVPVDLSTQLSLPATGASDPLIRTALRDIPLSGSAAGVRRATCDFEPIRDGLRLTTNVTMPRLGTDEAVVIEVLGKPVWTSPSEAMRHGGTLSAVTDLVPPSNRPFALARSNVRFTILADGRAVTWDGCTAP